jgi:hypothetical protein
MLKDMKFRRQGWQPSHFPELQMKNIGTLLHLRQMDARPKTQIDMFSGSRTRNPSSGGVIPVFCRKMIFCGGWQIEMRLIYRLSEPRKCDRYVLY